MSEICQHVSYLGLSDYDEGSVTHNKKTFECCNENQEKNADTRELIITNKSTQVLIRDGPSQSSNTMVFPNCYLLVLHMLKKKIHVCWVIFSFFSI